MKILWCVLLLTCFLIIFCEGGMENGECQDNTVGNGIFWTDKMNFTCILYEGADWCTPDGEEGPGWDHFWGHFHGFAAHGKSAKQACCGCGGGNTDPNTFDNNLPVYNGVPSYPYEEVDYHFSLPSDNECKRCHKCEEGRIWNDNWGYSCKAYHYGNFCTKDGQVGPGWSSDYGTIHSYHNACRDAFGACGACGFKYEN